MGKSCRAGPELGAGSEVRGRGAGIVPGAAHFSPLKTYLSKETTKQSHSFPGLCRPQTASPSPQRGLRGGREVEICKMSVGGEERRFVWGRGPGHWSAPGPPAAPRMLPSPGKAVLAGPRPAPGSLQPLHPLHPGLGDLGPWGRPASEDTGLVGRPPRVSACFSTGGSGVPTSWRPCLAPWPSWSWGPWSVSPGAPPWTSSRTLGVGVAHLPSRALSGGYDTWCTWLWPGHSAHATIGHSPGGVWDQSCS